MDAIMNITAKVFNEDDIHLDALLRCCKTHVVNY